MSLSNDAMVGYRPMILAFLGHTHISYMFMATVLHNFVLRVIFEAELTLKIN